MNHKTLILATISAALLWMGGGAGVAGAYWSGLTEVQRHGAVDAWQHAAGATQAYTDAPSKAYGEAIYKGLERSFADTHEFSLAPETVESFVQTGFTPYVPATATDVLPTLADGLSPLMEDLAPELLIASVGPGAVAVGAVALAGVTFGTLYALAGGLTWETPITEPLPTTALAECGNVDPTAFMSAAPCGNTYEPYEARSQPIELDRCADSFESPGNYFFYLAAGENVTPLVAHCESRLSHEAGQVELVGPKPFYVGYEKQIWAKPVTHFGEPVRLGEAFPLWSGVWGGAEGCPQATPAAGLEPYSTEIALDSEAECLAIVESGGEREYVTKSAPRSNALVTTVESHVTWHNGGASTTKPVAGTGLTTISVNPEAHNRPSAALIETGLKQVLDAEGNEYTEGHNPLRKYVEKGVAEGESEIPLPVMPNCIGLAYYECEAALEAVGIEWAYAPESGSDYRHTINTCTNFCIVSQSALPGTEIPHFTPVEIEYAPEIFTIPTPGELGELDQYIKELEEEGFTVVKETVSPDEYEEENETEKKRKRVVVTLPWPGKINELPWPGRGGTGSPREKTHREKIEREHGRPAQPKPGFSPGKSPQPGGEPGANPGAEPNPNGELGDAPESGAKVKVELNPETRPETPPFTGGGGGGPFSLDPPGIKKHIHLAVLCEKFPFGVPCWLIEELGDWSKSSTTPSLGWENFTICIESHCGVIPATHVSLAPLEPVMEYVRPAMVLFATVGLLLLLYRFAMGGSPSSGSQGDNTERGMDRESV